MVSSMEVRVIRVISAIPERELTKTGKAYAEAEREYKIAVCKKALELKDGGMPVTLIQLVIYGYQEIATLRFKRDTAQVIYNANQEAINSTKLEIRILQNQIEKEYYNEQ